MLSKLLLYVMTPGAPRPSAAAPLVLTLTTLTPACWQNSSWICRAIARSLLVLAMRCVYVCVCMRVCARACMCGRVRVCAPCIEGGRKENKEIG